MELFVLELATYGGGGRGAPVHLLSTKQAFLTDKLIMEMESRAQAYESVNLDLEFLSGASLHKLLTLLQKTLP